MTEESKPVADSLTTPETNTPIQAEQESTQGNPEQNSLGQTGGEPATVTLSQSEVEELRKLAGERQEYLDLARRTQADFQNYQKRMQREREQDREFLRAALMLELLPVLDNLERAVKAAKETGETGSLVQGVTLVHAQFLDLLKRQGVESIPAMGEPFDPSMHEALVQQPTKDHAPNTVIHVEQTGYKMNDRVIRPAKVVVASALPE